MAPTSRDKEVRTLGTIEDIYGRRLEVGVNYAAVTLSPYYELTPAQCLEFGRLFMRAYGIAVACVASEAADDDEPPPLEPCPMCARLHGHEPGCAHDARTKEIIAALIANLQAGRE